MRIPFKYLTVVAFIAALQLLWLPSLAHADVIYLINGNVLVVDRAWEEDTEVKYQAGDKIQSLPKKAVRRIQQQKPLPSAQAQGRKYGIAVESGQPSSTASATPPAEVPLRGAAGSFSKDALKRLRDN